MMKRINILGSVILFSLFLGSCMFPWAGASPESAFTSRDLNEWYDTVVLLDEWTAIDAKWHFKDGGELTIQAKSEITDAFWISDESTLEVIIKGESTIYDVQVISEDELLLTTGSKEIVLQK